MPETAAAGAPEGGGGNTAPSTGRSQHLRPPWQPGTSGNWHRRPRGEALVRRLLKEVFVKKRPEILAALERRFTNPKTVQECLELLAKLEGELTKDAGESARGVAVIILQNHGASPLDPEVFREAARRKALEMSSSSPRSSSERLVR